MRDALVGFLLGIVAAVAFRMSWEDEDIRETEDESLDQPVPYRPVYTCDQFEDEPTPSEMLEPDTELCYGFSTTPKGSPCS